jgi:Uma2 family endonuclease
MPPPILPFTNVAEMLEQLGGIDPRRVRSWPPPGKASEKDVLAIHDREDRLYELVDGVLVEKIMGFTESLIAAHLIQLLRSFVEARDLGLVAGAEGTLKLMPRLVRIPDVSFVSWLQLPERVYPSEPVPELHPDLAVEVLSKGNTPGEMARKLQDYFSAGTRLVWQVDRDTRTVRVHLAPDRFTTLTEADTLEGGAVLPGFALPLAQLFARMPRPSRSPKKTGKPGSQRRLRNHRNGPRKQRG